MWSDPVIGVEPKGRVSKWVWVFFGSFYLLGCILLAGAFRNHVPVPEQLIAFTSLLFLAALAQFYKINAPHISFTTLLQCSFSLGFYYWIP